MHAKSRDIDDAEARRISNKIDEELKVRIYLPSRILMGWDGIASPPVLTFPAIKRVLTGCFYYILPPDTCGSPFVVAMNPVGCVGGEGGDSETKESEAGCER